MNGCVHKQADGTCEKYTDDVVHSFCVDGPCEDRTPSKADTIRAMTDEELAKFLASVRYNSVCVLSEKYGCHIDMPCEECWLDWLGKEADE